ncbi:MAG: tetratricopeptide repeat protein [Nitrospina sp.]|jgi:tetratricopeptide (TPR) repeat protein|nr:tetratricopeptide repeat protein [Nitrospina sp.]MBT3507920.1 tetratricopeptide repeat protein [Nitrospina sp.]MBT3876446.1 tetratricopeptide repeat protein [Nitrospina sp.]MBT4048733.1 tetratricopeptide repeat protein [Nitrospina sp.]MBT4558032.1 tetratricopeptide repeat protein [Nitrospina sp.]
MKFKSRLTKITLCLLIFLCLLPAIALSQESYTSFLEKARNLDKDGFFEDAVKYWQKTLEANPPSNISLYAKLKLTNTYSQLGQLDKTIEISKALTESHPDHFDSWFHFANALAAMQQYPEAVEAFNKAILLKPEEGLGRVGLAFAYFGDGKPDSAIEEFRQAKKIFKANKNISWYRDCRLAINQIKGFARFPPKFADLWLGNNLKRVQDTYLNSVLDLETLLD